MNRPQTGRVRSLLITSGSAVIALFALSTPAHAGKTVKGTVKGTVSAGSRGLSVRAGATTLAPRLTILSTGTTVAITCQVTGQKVKGNIRTTNRWNKLTHGDYVSDAYIKRPITAPLCPQPSPQKTHTTTTPSGRWVAPVPYRTVQGFRTPGRPQHDGEDLIAPRYTPIRAVADGVVVTVVCNTSGTSCDIDGGPFTTGCGWYAEIKHHGTIVTRYCHMSRKPSVKVGQKVTAGQVIGHVGSSGHSSTPHLHFEVHTGYPATRSNAIDPLSFMERMGAPIGK